MSPAAGASSRLVVSDVHKSFGPLRVLDGLSLTVEPGSTTAVVGPSGSGKTTLLRIIAGFQRPDAGTVEVGSRVVAAPGMWVPAHQRRIGYVAQEGALFPHLSVGQNIAFGLTPADVPRGRGAKRERVTELLEMVSLDPALAGRKPHEISGGQQQRVALARALARPPELMLLDESFSSLDAGLRATTRRSVAKVLAAAGITTVLVTHDQAEALSFADQVAVIRDGVLAQVGAPRAVYNHPTDRDMAEFLGDAVVLDAWVADQVATCALGRVSVPDTTVSGAAELVLRPEQIRIDPTSELRGVVIDSEFYGADSRVSVRLPTPQALVSMGVGQDVPGRPGDTELTIRHWNSADAIPGAEIGLTVSGTGLAFPAALH